MTTREFKENYPQYKSLEGDELWDKMTEVMLQSSNVLTADPNREVTFCNPIDITVEENGTWKTEKWSIETNSTWLNSKGEKVKYIAGIDPYGKEHPTESYSFIIWDSKDGKNVEKL